MLDLGLVSPDRYACVDSSQAILNLLIRKHPKVAAVYPVDIRQALGLGTFTQGQFDWVFLDAAVELAAEQSTQVEAIARLAVIAVDDAEWTMLDVAESSVERTLADAETMKSLYWLA